MIEPTPENRALFVIAPFCIHCGAEPTRDPHDQSRTYAHCRKHLGYDIYFGYRCKRSQICRDLWEAGYNRETMTNEEVERVVKEISR